MKYYKNLMQHEVDEKTKKGDSKIGTGPKIHVLAPNGKNATYWAWHPKFKISPGVGYWSAKELTGTEFLEVTRKQVKLICKHLPSEKKLMEILK